MALKEIKIEQGGIAHIDEEPVHSPAFLHIELSNGAKYNQAFRHEDTTRNVVSKLRELATMIENSFYHGGE